VPLIQASFLSALLITVFSITAFAQDRCGTVEYTKKLQLKTFEKTKTQFEDWLLQAYQRQKTGRTLRKQSGPYKIPVVIHVIHNGEPEGTGTNISDAQILSQIRVLNDDYRRENSDAANTPPEFVSVAAGMDIEFVLAKSDPEGLATDGIVRVQGSQTQWTVGDNYELKSLSYWPAEDYMNIWVCNITDYLGYAQFPVSNLSGLEESSNNRLTDGVVIYYRAFGSDDDGNFDLESDYNKGRTTTHEVSHFFGLRHIWGDDSGNCGEPNDFVTDTPDQAGNTSGCPTHPRVTCNNAPSMFMNFTDYTDDECMNLFTQGQIDRMQIVIENSPRRKSLLTSPGLNPPAPQPNDLGIRQVISPQQSECSQEVVPQIEIRNYGSNDITSAKIRLTVNGVIVETKDFTLNLQELEASIESFSAVTLNTGFNNVSFDIIQTNGVTDSNDDDNTVSISVLVPETIETPFIENFNTLPDNWTIINEDQGITWQLVNAPSTSPSNEALMLDFYNYEDKQGEVDILLSPVFDLTNDTVASVIFDVAYARYQTSIDRLKVYVITDCSEVYDGTLIFNEGGSGLATAAPTTSNFIPADESEWKKHVININQFLGEDHVQLAFVGINDWGNVLYLDNVGIVTTVMEDVALKRVSSPSIVTCDETPSPRLTVQNLGNKPLQKFTVEYSVNNQTPQKQLFTDMNIAMGEEIEIQLPSVTLTKVVNTIAFTILDPNDSIDDNTENNTAEIKVILNKESDRIPLRENFDTDHSPWVKVNALNGINWQITETNYANSMYFNSFDNEELNDQAWLVSPSLDFSLWSEASMKFDLSYRSRAGKTENLEIYALTECGNSYEKLNFNFGKLSLQSSSESWLPASEEDWQKLHVDLSNFAGLKDVRIAFVVTNRNGNNLYIDNIEFFTTSSPNAIAAENPYALFGYQLDNLPESVLRIKFNLPEKQTVRFMLVDPMGKILSSAILPDMLNQTYTLETGNIRSAGIYFVYLLIGNKQYATRVFITP
jgi:hypothetical protein